MPELPEVETIRKGLQRKIVGKRISHVRVKKAKIVRGLAKAFTRDLTGKVFSKVKRHGKLLIFSVASEDLYVLAHLKMTGQFVYQDANRIIAGGHQWPPVRAAKLPGKHTHIVFDFSDGSKLFFNDMRQFGFTELVTKKRMQEVISLMGPDPVTQLVTFDYFFTGITRRKIPIKAVLLDQKFVAGVGNIYADEMCFHARVLPQREANSLTEVEVRALFRSLTHILNKALKYGGTTFRDYVDVEGDKGNFTKLLKVYGRGGQKCRRCKKDVIRKTRVAQRGTHYCPSCQK